MRIDVNAYLGAWDFRSKGIADPARLLDKEAEAGVDVVVVSSPNGVSPAGDLEGNRRLLAVLSPYPRRIYMVARVDPAWEIDETIEFLANDAVAAIRLPAVRNEALLEREARLIAAAASLGLPVYLTLGVAHLWDVAEDMDPKLVQSIVSAYPEAIFVLAGEGQFQYPILRDAIQTYNNIYMDISRNHGLAFVAKYVREFGANRVLFGTAAGILHPCLALGKVEASRISPAEKRAIYSENALRAFRRLRPSVMQK